MVDTKSVNIEVIDAKVHNNQTCLSKLCQNLCAFSDDEEIGSITKMIKILVIGPGGSGKSTVLKQMRIIHGEKFQRSEQERFRRPIIENVFQSIYHLVEAMHAFNLKFQNDQNNDNYNCLLEAKANLIADMNDWNKNKQMYGLKIKDIWNDKTIRVCFDRRNQFYLHDSTEYFMQHIDRITSNNYLPIIDDILRVREPTTAIIEHQFKIQDTDFLFVDVGGQRSERKKWINCFESITSILFIASLSDYDLSLTADELRGTTTNQNQNRLREALDLFRTTINWKKKVYLHDNNKNRANNNVHEELLFKNIGIILFLNKEDLFDKKIQHSPLSNCFSDFIDGKYDKSQRAKAGKEFIAKKFIDCNEFNGELEDKPRNIYWHYTFALDRESMEVVIASVRERVIEEMLRNLML